MVRMYENSILRHIGALWKKKIIFGQENVNQETPTVSLSEIFGIKRS